MGGLAHNFNALCWKLTAINWPYSWTIRTVKQPVRQSAAQRANRSVDETAINIKSRWWRLAVTEMACATQGASC
ncbi:hypothetical protein O9929_17650 [Vibrio lentus]|nr:hypothetical protein [Vibrio lentus]